MPVSAILLAAGYATRLYPLTKNRPKALLPLGKGVVLDAVLGLLDGIPDVTRRVLVTNHRFASQFGEWQQARGLDVTVVDDGTQTNETRLGAIQDLELARTRGSATGDLLVVGTDNLFSWSMADFVSRAQRHRPQPSVALWEAPSKASATQFGVVTLDAAARIMTFVEKSPQPPSTDVALCVYYFPEPMLGRIQQFLDAGGNPDAPGYFIEWLIHQEATYGEPMGGTWFDIGSHESYAALLKAWPALATRTAEGRTSPS